MFDNVTTAYDKSDATWEIIIMLLVAFALGFILRHLFCCSKTEQHVEPRETEQESSQQKVEETNKTGPTRVALALAAAGIAEPVAGEPAEQAAPNEPESLQRVEGIGPKIEGLLWAGGILTMRQLADSDLDVLQKILDDAGPRYRMHNPKTWPIQAELIVDEKWDELKRYQDFLIAGRE